MAETAKAENNPESDDSMEEILDSIRKIIADDEDQESDGAGQEEEVLELTDVVEEGGEVPDVILSPEESAAEDEIRSGLDELLGSSDEEDEGLQDDLADLDSLMAEMEAEEKEVIEAPAPAADSEPEKPAEPAQAAAPSKKDPASSTAEQEALLSEDVSQRSREALTNLMAALPSKDSEAAGMSFRSGLTIEDLVKEELRPLLQEWLNENLSPLVERLVQKEIKRITSALDE